VRDNRVYVSLYFDTQLSLSIRSFLDGWRSGVELRPYTSSSSDDLRALEKLALGGLDAEDDGIGNEISLYEIAGGHWCVES
jgi:hypothetical protein